MAGLWRPAKAPTLLAAEEGVGRGWDKTGVLGQVERVRSPVIPARRGHRPCPARTRRPSSVASPPGSFFLKVVLAIE